MSMTKDELLAAAMTLPPAEREAIADELWRSIDGDIQPEIDAAWADEIRRRVAAHERDPTSAKPVDEVIRRLRNRPRP